MPDETQRDAMRPVAMRVVQRGAAELRIFEDADALVTAAAAALLEVRAAGPCHIALAGGSTPEALYRRIADLAPGGWDDTQLWFGDERGVGPEHADSNWRMAKDAFMHRVAIAPEQVHRMRGELTADDAAYEYEAELRASFGAVPWPRFDIVLLGVGEDGHTASLFPGTTALGETTRWVVPNWVPKLDTWRITLSMPVLCAAKQAWIFAVGARKAAILREVLGGREDPRAYPVQAVVPSDGGLVWWIDEAAAAELG